MGLQLHQVDITAYATDLRAELRGLDSIHDSIHDWVYKQLELIIYRRDGGNGWKAEILLSFGGPNVWIELDSRYSCPILHHGWGADPRTCDTQLEIEFYSPELLSAVTDIVEL